jgi:hypothetical protein
MILLFNRIFVSEAQTLFYYEKSIDCGDRSIAWRNELVDYDQRD